MGGLVAWWRGGYVLLGLEHGRLPGKTGKAMTYSASDPVVHAVTSTQGYLGYCVHAREFFCGLSRHLRVSCTQWQQNSPLHDDADVFRDRALLRDRFGDEAIVSIGLSLGSAFYILKDAPGPRIGYTVWDTTRLPDTWEKPLGMVDRIWVPSKWARGVLGGNGVDTGRVDVMPEGVDAVVFRPDGPHIANIADLPGFKFINVGKFEERKATGEMIKAFDDEFAGEKDVWFIVSCYNPFDKTFDLRASVRALNLRDPERFLFIPPLPTHADIAKLYRSCDAFLGASRAEGWGLCHMEAAACGLPLVTTNYSAPAEWAAGHAYFLDYEMTGVKTPFFIRRDGDQGEWAEPDWSQFRRFMRHLVDNPDEARRRGREISDHVRANYAWPVTAAHGAEVIRRIVGRSAGQSGFGEAQQIAAPGDQVA
jgi:glycosyltransferase involved in cell wall biosynthesis